MKKVKILGTGCAKCLKLEENTREALKELGLDYTLEKVTDINDIMNYGIMMTPGLVLDEKVISSGKLLNKIQIMELLK
ncbi:MAG: TM0996/MTH895 family glutaredoxin-like protein [Desulfobulbaceae bacterium]|nr:TM0996/MTH895 family glutaredoxin-like protein [Candidatus Kapabacteria bacterium]MBS4000159.1 TM0996/MTH895 family glutaredoxin-like protein [Desulfobulbaceae bacterium]